jgi:MFS family permease
MTGTAGNRARLLVVVLAHYVIDFLSMMVMPVLSVLEGRVEMSPRQGATLLALGGISSGLVQPLIAALSDRWDTRWFGTAGFVLAAGAISCIGFAHTPGQLMALHVVGALGVGAVHPIAAAAAGQLSGARRSQGVSLFYAAGIFGGISGSVSVPWYVKSCGAEAIVWSLAPSAVMVVLMAWAIHAVAHRHGRAHAEHAALSAGERASRWRDVGLLWLGNAMRFMVNSMLVQLVIRWSEHEALTRAGAERLDEGLRTAATKINGPMQAAMQLGMGVSGLLAGVVLRRHHERAALIGLPILCAGGVAAFPHAESGVARGLCVAVAGVGFAGVMPVTITLAQRLLPHRTFLASGLMMGGAWSVAAAGPPIVQQMIDRGVTFATIFAGVSALLAASGLVGVGVRSAGRWRAGEA